MTDLDRRQFLKGLLGVTAVAAIAAPELARASQSVSSKVDDPCSFLGIDHAHGPDKTGFTVGHVEVKTGSITIDGNAHIVPGDTITLQYSHSGQDIYEVKAVANDGSGDVTIAIVHEDREVQMHRDKVEPWLNEELYGHGHELRPHPPADPKVNEEIRRMYSEYGRKPGRYTWPQPRRRGRR